MTEKIFGKLVQEIEENYMTIDNAILKDMERRYIYFRGHTDGYAYLKENGVIKEKKE